jgi:hypothetical protein
LSVHTVHIVSSYIFHFSKFTSGEELGKYLNNAFDAMCGELDKTESFLPMDMGFLVAYNILASMSFGKK